jgi:hypothetical protein
LVTYNADGLISKIEVFKYMNTPDQQNELYELTYASKQLIQVSVSTKNSGQWKLSEEHIYSYTGNNIIKSVEKDYSLGVLMDTDSATYTYDNKPNYLKKQSPQFILTDPFFFTGDYSPYYPMFLSENNIIKVANMIDPSDVVNFTYEADNKDNVTQIKIDGTPALKYIYGCP